MLPALGRIKTAFLYLARRYALNISFPTTAIASALADAQSLVRSDRDEPAALFFVLCARARALGPLWPILPGLIAANHARSLGLSMRYDRDTLRGLRVRIVARSVSFDEVRREIDTLIS